MEYAAPVPVEIENPYGMEAYDVQDPGIWLLSPVPMAFLCFGIAALASRLVRRGFEGVGAAVGLAAGVALIAILQDKTQNLADNLIANWPWLIAVMLLGIAGGSAARIAGPVPVSVDRARLGAWIAARMLAASLLGSSAMLIPAFSLFALRHATIDATLGWMLFFTFAGCLALGGWMVGRIAPRFPVLCAIASVYVPYFATLALTPLEADELDVSVGLLAVMSVPAAVAAYISSTRSRRERAQRDKESSGFIAELVQFAVFGIVSVMLLGAAWTVSRANCRLQRQMVADRLGVVKGMQAPSDVLSRLADEGLEARLVKGGVGDYEIEVLEPQSACNLFSRRRFFARYPDR